MVLQVVLPVAAGLCVAGIGTDNKYTGKNEKNIKIGVIKSFMKEISNSTVVGKTSTYKEIVDLMANYNWI